MRVNEIVRYREPMDEFECSQRFVVLEVVDRNVIASDVESDEVHSIPSNFLTSAGATL